jgi:serine/tyrosine/threonine adenylyltransferase
VSEAMHALGLPTTRALAAVATGDWVFREGRLPGAILTRVAASHVRVGTFQFFAASGDTGAVKQLADYVIERHYPEIAAASNPYLELLRAVSRRQARLVAGWMSVGFIHGVMNTDNMAISGETIDFGPCAFMDEYDPATVFSSIDRMGRYAYGNQPPAAQWNLARLAETLLPLIDPANDAAIAFATDAINEFSGEFAEQWLSAMRRKLGLFTAEHADEQLIRGLLEIMQREHADFTLTFRGLCAVAGSGAMSSAAQAEPESAAASGVAADAAAMGGGLDADWVRAWRTRLAREAQPADERAASMRRVNPAFIPRNHRIEAVIAAAVERGDYAPFEELGRVLARPYEEQPARAEYAEPPLPGERVLHTFCGT